MTWINSSVIYWIDIALKNKCEFSVDRKKVVGFKQTKRLEKSQDAQKKKKILFHSDFKSF